MINEVDQVAHPPIPSLRQTLQTEQSFQARQSTVKPHWQQSARFQYNYATLQKTGIRGRGGG